MTVFKTAVTIPGLPEAVQEAYSTAGKFLYSNEKYNLGIEDAQVSIESIPIDGKDTLHIAFAWDLDWDATPAPKFTSEEAAALWATMDPKDQLIDSLYEQVRRLQLRVIAAANLNEERS